jgi:hypothetical protein
MVEWFYAYAPPSVVATSVVLLLIAAGLLGIVARRWFHRQSDPDERGAEQLIVSAILGLVALLLGFTFALAIDRFDRRGALVVQEANAIGTTWLRAQLLDEPHRSQLSRLLEGYAENRLRLARAETPEAARPLLARNDLYQRRLWAATVAAVRPIRHLEISSVLVEAMNATIDIDAERRAVRRAHVPPRVLTALLLCMAVAAYAVGYGLLMLRVKWSVLALLVLLTMAYLLILDIDQPTRGGIKEPQRAMEELVATMRAGPPASLGR